jgi:valyl-tRNA synthetase
VSAKLGNAGFMAKAPADVVANARERLAAAEADIARLEARLAAL